jgi:hypothetical protein
MPVVWFVVPAVVNLLLTAAAFGASSRRLAFGVLFVVAVTTTYTCAMWLWPGDPSAHSKAELFWMYAGISGFTWLPGGMLAVAAARCRNRWRTALGVGAICAGGLFGACYIYTALGFACGMFGDCP